MKIGCTLGGFALAAMLASCDGTAALPTAAVPTGSPFTANPVTATPAPTLAPATTAPAAGAISGRLAYPSDFIPALTVYAISVSDQRVFFSVDMPRYPPATIPPGGLYTISGVAPGTYYVLAYRNSDRTFINNDGPALYSRFVVQCQQPGQQTPYPTGPCPQSSDHTLVPVTVRPGETVSRIDMTDWFSQLAPSYPARPTSVPVGFVLPATCSYVGSPVVGSDSSRWKFDCGAAADRDARGTLAPAFQQQGWSSCGVGLGTATWKKFDFRLSVSEGSGAAAPDGLPTLTQFGGTIQTPCG